MKNKGLLENSHSHTPGTSVVSLCPRVEPPTHDSWVKSSRVQLGAGESLPNHNPNFSSTGYKNTCLENSSVTYRMKREVTGSITQTQYKWQTLTHAWLRVSPSALFPWLPLLPDARTQTDRQSYRFSSVPPWLWRRTVGANRRRKRERTKLEMF